MNPILGVSEVKKIRWLSPDLMVVSSPARILSSQSAFIGDEG